jgi:hypothetical protein
MSKTVTAYVHRQASGSPVVNGMRADLNADSRTCGCGEPARFIHYLATFRIKNGRKQRDRRRVPLCARHSAAHDAQAARRRAAIARTWQG